ncbi:PIR Superfamily Protein [Plasmodium ovale curtisi]|uniref:PIR Superfamily Protein n=1 Tax=Plasmodium ovale curtisi TaxID=864141 RepID=A0A1A8WU80_PLAOA|nr:PIR Superfamily Protein [Plasmodium ovale curtisi]
MSTKNEDAFLKELENRQFPLNMIYRFYGGDYRTENKSNNYCDYLIEGDNPEISNIRQLCKAFFKVLDSFERLIRGVCSNDASRCCKYLYYWLHYQIRNTNPSRENMEKLYYVIDLFKADSILDGKCPDPREFNINNKSDEIKKLHFYSEGLYWIKKEKSHLFTHDKDSYRNYLEECSNYYNKDIRDKYCEHIKKYEFDIEDFEKEFNETKQFLSNEITGISTKTLNTIDKKACPPDVLYQSAVKQELNGYLTSAPKVSSHSSGTETNSELHGKTHKNITSGIVSGIIVGTLFLSFIAYKFTPLGIWIKSRIRDIRKKINNEENENNITLLDIFDNHENNLENGNYSINYHSL